ncbi:hypothetical protein KM295_03955 [Natronomonas sp. F2-12]|uniref:Uncharacterized protein n=1 Tax=Natronomonas aquatica TaxID=2841590 RepID=A0A9R1CRH2_9EURY|nr:hypothetical protein [Natronomonas aquatica]MCQ4332657.1 hypothetical protein [Natronomonas aquatica]
MSRDGVDRRFVRPACHGSVPADPPIRRALVRHGCVLCGTTVTTDAFTV